MQQTTNLQKLPLSTTKIFDRHNEEKVAFIFVIIASDFICTSIHLECASMSTIYLEMDLQNLHELESRGIVAIPMGVRR